MRPTWCDIDLSAIRHNVSVLSSLVPNAEFCAVVKADGYGHGSVPVAEAALSAGATRLAVALVEEGIELRAAGVDSPILLLSEPRSNDMAAVVAHRLTPSVYSPTGISSAGEAAEAVKALLPVEICVDTGMRRVGMEPDRVADARSRIDAQKSLKLSGMWTHCAVADEPDNPFTALQAERFSAVLDESESVAGAFGEGFVAHIGNSAVALGHADSALDMVRIGIAMYGIDPSPELAGRVALEPALALRSAVSFVKPIRAGEGVGYGHRWVAPSDGRLATVPVGYADGVRRDLGLLGGEVLIGGRRRPIVGVVTMDQMMVDLGEDAEVRAGDEVVLIGRQGDNAISVADIATILGTIPYEVVSTVGVRIPRRHRHWLH